MPRLINATRIKRYILNNGTANEGINAINVKVIYAPTVYVVGPVHCKECKYYSADGWGFGNCSKPCAGLSRMSDSSYCSWGERIKDA